MRVDRTVAQAKFARELEILRAHLPTLSARGICLHKAEFPCVDVVFVSGQPLRVCGVIRPMDVPMLGQRPFGVRFDMEDFDLTAPSATFRDVRDWKQLPVGAVKGFHEIAGQPTPVLLHHPTLNRPFLCMQGIREYHQHPDHTNDDWLSHRHEGALLRAVETVWATCVDAVQPIAMIDGTGRLNFDLVARG